jgi:hypothetical protein
MPSFFLARVLAMRAVFVAAPNAVDPPSAPARTAMTWPRGDSVEKTRLGVSDVDYDGLTDLILHIDRNGGTRMRVLKTRYDRMQVAQEWQEPFDWRDVRPF